MDLVLQGRVAVAGTFQHGVRVALPVGKHSSVVFQLALDPDPGWVSPLLSSHLPEDRGTLARTGGGTHVPRVAQLSLGVSPVQKSCRSDSARATQGWGCPSLPQGPYPAHAGGRCSAECQQ